MPDSAALNSTKALFTSRSTAVSHLHRSSLLLVSALLLTLAAPSLSAQTAAATAPTPASIETNRKALDEIFKDYWEDALKHNPEMASELGDKRYNDQVNDQSVRAINDALARGQTFMMRLAAIDTAGLGDQEKVSYDLLLRRLLQQQEGSGFKEWEMPVNQMGGIYSDYPQLVAELSFTTVKDYDDWIARL